YPGQLRRGAGDCRRSGAAGVAPGRLLRQAVRKEIAGAFGRAGAPAEVAPSRAPALPCNLETLMSFLLALLLGLQPAAQPAPPAAPAAQAQPRRPAAATMDVRVTDRSGNPAAGAQVTAEGPSSREGVTD